LSSSRKDLLLAKFFIIVHDETVSSDKLKRVEEKYFIKNFVLDESLYKELFTTKFKKIFL